MTLASFPNANYPGFESQMFLIPQAGLVAGASVDWYSTNVVNFFVNEQPDGSGLGTLQYKVNDPADWTARLIVSQTNYLRQGSVGKVECQL